MCRSQTNQNLKLPTLVKDQSCVMPPVVERSVYQLGSVAPMWTGVDWMFGWREC